MENSTDDLGEKFLKINANIDYMSVVFASFIRNSMRAVASTDPSTPRYKAMQDFTQLLALMKHSEGVGLYALLELSTQKLTPSVQESDAENDEERYYNHCILNAAMTGLQLVLERSTNDGFTKSRLQMRERDFIRCLREIDEASQLRAKRYATERAPAKASKTRNQKKR